ncbi:MAG: hypothetical protein ABIR08_08570 [Sphingomonas sp.]
MPRFKLVRVMMGSGWPSGHIAIDEYHTFPNKAGGGEMCLTLDAQNTQEISKEIDELILELEEIRATAGARFEEWNASYETSKKNRQAR